MNDRERLEAIVKVVRQYLPPDGISIKEAMGKIIELVDPMDEDQYWGKLSEEHLHALKKDMRAKAKKYMEEISVVIEVKDDKPPVKSYCGGKPNYCTPEETPDVDAVNISAECVDEKAKDRLVRIMGTFDLATGHADTLDQALDALEEELRDVLGHLRAMREWVGLTDEEVVDLACSVDSYKGLVQAVEAKLREKNGG